MNKLNISNTIAIKKDKIVENRIGDVSKLIPAEVKADTKITRISHWNMAIP